MTSADAGSVFVIISFILMVLGTVGSSFAIWYYQKESKRIREEKRERNRRKREKEAAAVVIAANGDIQVNDDDELIDADNSRDDLSQRSGSIATSADTEGPNRSRSSTKRRSKKET